MIWNIPAYVTSVKNAFLPLAQKLMTMSGVEEFMAEMAKANSVTFKEMTENTLIDVMSKFKPDNWTALADKFPDIAKTVTDTQTHVDKMNYFLGLNIADAPMQIFMRAISTGAILLAIGAALIPILSALSQWLNTKLMTAMNPNSNANTNGQADTMANTMKTMNNFMPVFSAFMCFTFQVGIGIYWVAGAVIRSLQMLLINHYIGKVDMDELIKKNMEKAAKKR